MKCARLVMLIAGTASLAACGRMAPLQPGPGQSLPVKPLMARTTPDAEELLDAPTFARPQRVDELIRRSQPRERDRFDLPPPAGGAVPLPAPAGEADEPPEEAGPATPDE